MPDVCRSFEVGSSGCGGEGTKIPSRGRINNPGINRGMGSFSNFESMMTHFGKGDSNPFQYSWPENSWTEKPCELQFMGSQSQIRLGTHTHIHMFTGDLENTVQSCMDTTIIF